MTKWQTKKLAEVLSEVSDGNYSSKYPRSQDFVNEGAPFIRAINFKDGKIVWNDMKYITSEKHAELKKGHLKTDDILITTRGEIGNTAHVTPEFRDANINAQIVRLQPNQDEVIPLFLFYLLNSQYIKSQYCRITTGSTLKQLSIQNLHLLEVKVPSLSIQKKIVERLDAIRKLQELNNKEIEKNQELFDSITLKIFKSFKKNKMEKLGNLTSVITKGTTPTTYGHQFTNSGTPFLRVENINNKVIEPKTTSLYISEETNKFLKRSRTKPKDVLITIAGTIGRIGYISEDQKEEMNMNQAVALVRVGNKLNHLFLFYLLQSKGVQKQMMGARVTGTITNLSLTTLKNLNIPVLPLSAQKNIVNQLDSVKNNQRKLESSKLKLSELFNSTLNKAMKGELVS